MSSNVKTVGTAIATSLVAPYFTGAEYIELVEDDSVDLIGAMDAKVVFTSFVIGEPNGTRCTNKKTSYKFAILVYCGETKLDDCFDALDDMLTNVINNPKQSTYTISEILPVKSVDWETLKSNKFSEAVIEITVAPN